MVLRGIYRAFPQIALRGSKRLWVIGHRPANSGLHRSTDIIRLARSVSCQTRKVAGSLQTSCRRASYSTRPAGLCPKGRKRIVRLPDSHTSENTGRDPKAESDLA